MANVPFLSVCLISYFTFIPVLYFIQMFTLKLIQITFPKLGIVNVKIFEFNKTQVFYIFGAVLILLIFAKLAKASTLSIYIFIYLNIAIFATLLLFFNFFNATKSSQLELDTLLTTSIWLFFAIATFCFCTNFIILLFNIELVATIYFFFFLFYLTHDLNTIIKFKNLLSNYLFVSFFTICGVTVALLLVVFYTGTVHFYELNMVGNNVPFFVWNILLLALLTKLGGPGVFFFKVEIYKILPVYSLIFFSICSFLINSMIILFIFKTCIIFYTANSFLILAGLLVGNLVVIVRGFQLVSFCQFLGLSAVNTWGLLMTFFLVIDSKFFYNLFLYNWATGWKPGYVLKTNVLSTFVKFFKI